MPKKQYVANEVNAEKVSETPSVLVAEAPQGGAKKILEGVFDENNNLLSETEKGQISGQLSPNPAGSGFVKQHFVDSLPESGNANELYIIPQKVNGGIVGYKNYKYNIATKKWERVFGSDPLLKLTKGGQGTLAHTNNPERKAFAKIFNGNVAIVGGKLYIDEDYTDTLGGTKLYKHDVVIDVVDIYSHDEYELHGSIISNVSYPYDRDTIIADKTKIMTNFREENAYSAYCVILCINNFDEQNDTIQALVNDGGDIAVLNAVFDIQSLDIDMTDTVTPL